MGQKSRKLKELVGWASVEGHWLRRRHFTPDALARIGERIKTSEQDHTGELMVAIEAVSPAHEPDSRLRALEVFGRLGVWNTPLDTGVLLYLALDKHHIQIIADRGIAASGQAWDDVCAQLRARFQAGNYTDGVFAAIDSIEAILRLHCPALPMGAGHTNDLPNDPVML